jgi:hypothetical protein
MAVFINRLPLPVAVLQQFSQVNLIDSSLIPLPSDGSEYPGCGRRAAKATEVAPGL